MSMADRNAIVLGNGDPLKAKEDPKQISNQILANGYDVRFAYVKNIVEITYRTSNAEKLKQFLTTENTNIRIDEFLNNPEIRLLLFAEVSPGKFVVYTTAPPATSNCDNMLYVLKTAKAIVNIENYMDEIMIGVLNRNILESMARLVKDIFMPLISNVSNQNAWPEMVTNTLTENIQVFMSSLQITLGQTRGETCLPLPPETKLFDSPNGSNSSNVSTLSSTLHIKDQIHVLEGCLITWTKQIKNILKQDPEAVINQVLSI